MVGPNSFVRLFQVLVFWFLIFVLTSLYCTLIPAVLIPRRWPLRLLKSYLAAVFFLMRIVLGVTWHVSGSVAAASGPVLIAAKHQSAFETLVLQYVLDDPAIVLKKELLAIPLIGWVLMRLGHIGVDRDGGIEAARNLRDAAKQAHKQGRPVVIFPEGARRAIGQPSDYKSGVDLLYALLKCRCIPVAVNSGLLLSTKALTPRPGHITIKFLPSIEAGLPREVFNERLRSDIEQSTSQLVRNGC